MTNPEDMLADASEIKMAIKSLRKKHHIESLIRRGIAPERIEGIIRDAEAAAEMIAAKAMARIAHRKRAKLRMVKS
jgi:collagenase-like PrtC family protease